MEGITIAFIIFVLLIISVGIFVGIVMMKKSQDRKERVDSLLNTPGIHLFKECNYGGDPIQLQSELPETEEDYGVIDGSLIYKSFILTSGYKIDTYNKQNEEGVKISYTGPKEVSCLETPIKSVRITKA
jgi:hypothetical protein